LEKQKSKREIDKEVINMRVVFVKINTATLNMNENVFTDHADTR